MLWCLCIKGSVHQKNLKDKATKPGEESRASAGCGVGITLTHSLFHFCLVKLFTAFLQKGLEVKACICASLFGSSVAINHVAWEEEVLKHFSIFIYCLQSPEPLGRWDENSGLLDGIHPSPLSSGGGIWSGFCLDNRT